MNQVTLIIYGKQHVLTNKSLNVLKTECIDILSSVNTQHAKQAIKFLKISRFFFRIDTDSKISCSLTKL